MLLIMLIRDSVVSPHWAPKSIRWISSSRDPNSGEQRVVGPTHWRPTKKSLRKCRGTKKMNSEAQKMVMGGGLRYFFGMFAPKIEKDETILTHTFQMGGNHQPEVKYTLQKSLLLLKIQRTK